jgi:hypothetical protein
MINLRISGHQTASTLVWLGLVFTMPQAGSAQIPPEPASPITEHAGATWVPAAEGNFAPANRPVDGPLDMVIIHDIEGSTQAAVSIFQRPGAKVSAHYIVGNDGKVLQMLRERDVGWHAGNGAINRRSIGIEMEGHAYRPGFYSPTLYETTARLVRDITTRRNIPRDRTHIISHAEVPSPRDPTKFGGASGHTDPGPYWNWNMFMTLVRNHARVVESTVPATIRPGEVLPASVTFENAGDDPWPGNAARNPNTGLQASGPVVYLGTEQAQASPFFNLQGWVSPILAAGTKADVAPGTTTRFEFTLRGPNQLGDINQTLRLSTWPTAAQGGSPVAFGDKVEMKVKVVPWTIDLAAPDSPAPSPAQPATIPASIAQWTTNLPTGGYWAIYASPPKPSKLRRAPAFVYGIGVEKGETKIEARDAGKGFVFLGYHLVPEPTRNASPLSVSLKSAPQGINSFNAGALRFVGPFANLPSVLDTMQAKPTSR